MERNYLCILKDQIDWAKHDRGYRDTDDLDALKIKINQSKNNASVAFTKVELGLAKVITKRAIRKLECFDYSGKYGMSAPESEDRRREAIQPLEWLMEWLCQMEKGSEEQ